MMSYILPGPVLCLVVGVPASGKTSLASGLGRAVENAACLSKDLIESEFTREERLTGEMYALVRGPAFHILVRFADLHLSLGKHPIIDAPFSINHFRGDEFTDWVSPFREAAQKHSARLAIVRCRPPDEAALRRRIEQRGYLWDRWKLEHWEEFRRQEPFDFPIGHDDVYEAAGGAAAEELVRDVLVNYLKAAPAKLVESG